MNFYCTIMSGISRWTCRNTFKSRYTSNIINMYTSTFITMLSGISRWINSKIFKNTFKRWCFITSLSYIIIISSGISRQKYTSCYSIYTISSTIINHRSTHKTITSGISRCNTMRVAQHAVCQCIYIAFVFHSFNGRKYCTPLVFNSNVNALAGFWMRKSSGLLLQFTTIYNHAASPN